MFTLLLLVALQTTPSNITKVPRVDPIADLCNWKGTMTSVAVGELFEAVLYIDAERPGWSTGFNPPLKMPNLYQHVGVMIMPPCWEVCGSTEVLVASSPNPVCPSGTVNAGKRPHVVAMPGFSSPGTYNLRGLWIDRMCANKTAVCTSAPVGKFCSGGQCVFCSQDTGAMSPFTSTGSTCGSGQMLAHYLGFTPLFVMTVR